MTTMTDAEWRKAWDEVRAAFDAGEIETAVTRSDDLIQLWRAWQPTGRTLDEEARGVPRRRGPDIASPLRLIPPQLAVWITENFDRAGEILRKHRAKLGDER